MKRDDAYRIAIEMYKREHDRWIQNAVVLFSAVIAILLLYFKTVLKDHRWASPLVMLACTIVSVMIVGVALSIRESTDAWGLTIRQIAGRHVDAERVEPFLIFRRFMRLYRRHSRRRIELCYILCPQFWPNKVFFSVTRFYALMGFLLFLVFASAFLFVTARTYGPTLFSVCLPANGPKGCQTGQFSGMAAHKTLDFLGFTLNLD
jgi:hypothetical protein